MKQKGDELKRGDLIWGVALFCILAFIAVPATHSLFVLATKSHPYLMAFVKVSVLASMGELLGYRISTGEWKRADGFLLRLGIWGLIGMSMALAFEVYSTGVASASVKGLLPLGSGRLRLIIGAFFTSVIMNLTFGPAMMAFHRITDTYIQLSRGDLRRLIALEFSQVSERAEWNGFLEFVVGKTIPFFWIPAHTVTFLLAPEYRVLMAASLSTALGAILAFAKSRSRQAKSTPQRASASA